MTTLSTPSGAPHPARLAPNPRLDRAHSLPVLLTFIGLFLGFAGIHYYTDSVMNRVASRIVSQQLAAEPALQAIHVFLPESGNIASFRRSVQVDGGAPLELDLKVSKDTRVPLPRSPLASSAIAP